MAYLYSERKERIIADIHSFLDQYRDWILENKQIAETDRYARFKRAASGNLEACEKILDRIRHSVDLLETDENAWKAFRYANEAMCLQRCKTIEKLDLP